MSEHTEVGQKEAYEHALRSFKGVKSVEELGVAMFGQIGSIAYFGKIPINQVALDIARQMNRVDEALKVRAILVKHFRWLNEMRERK